MRCAIALIRVASMTTALSDMVASEVTASATTSSFDYSALPADVG